MVRLGICDSPIRVVGPAREENVFADKISKLLIPDVWMMAPKFFEIGGIRDGGFDVWRNAQI